VAAVVALALALMLLSGGAIAGALIVTQRARRELEQRVNHVVGSSTASDGRGAETPSPWITALEARLLRVFGVGLAHQWGARVPSFQLILIAVLSAVSIWALTRIWVTLPLWIALPLTAVAFILAPRTLLQIQQSRTERRFIELFPDALDMCVRMLRAGLPISAAIRTIGNEGPKPINQVFSTIADRVEIGIPLEEALRAIGKELGLDEFRFFAAVVALQRSTGGNLAQTLEVLAEIMRKRRAMRLKARATTSEVRTSAYILGSMPFLIIGALLLLSPDYLEPLVSDTRGNIIVACAATSLGLAFYSMRRLVRTATMG
jgi:tight adherence protein B